MLRRCNKLLIQYKSDHLLLVKGLQYIRVSHQYRGCIDGELWPDLTVWVHRRDTYYACYSIFVAYTNSEARHEFT